MANEVMLPLEQIGMMAKAVSDSGISSKLWTRQGTR